MVFYGYFGKWLYVLCFLLLFGAMCDSFGIMMLLPILNFNKLEDSNNYYTEILCKTLESLGLGVSLTSLLFVIFIIFSLKGCFMFLQKGFLAYILCGFEKRIKIDFCHKYESMKYGYFVDTKIGYLNNIVTTEIARAMNCLNTYVEVLANIIFVTIYILAAFFINFKLTVIVLFVCSLLFVAMKSLARISKNMSVLISENNAETQSVLLQIIGNFKYLKATNSFKRIFDQLFVIIESGRKYNFKGRVLVAIPLSIIDPISVLLLSGLIYYNVEYKGESLSSVLILSLIFYRLFSRVFSFQAFWQKFNSLVGGIEVLRKATKVFDIQKEHSGKLKIEKFEKAIELKGISFSFSSKQVLSDINMTIPKNKSIGIVGESGAGKTTLFDIFTGLLVPQSGTVCIDGIDYREIDISAIRNLIGYVTQDAIIFNDSFANNITLWKCNFNDYRCREKIENASIMANCDTFIKETSMGYETEVGDRGIRVSGGQKQRISIAREIYRNPDIMIFDEATSALDSESEDFVQKSINAMKGQRTVVIIAHRLSTVKKCDYIYVLKNGRIVEEGNFQELCSNTNSHFFRMCEAQNLQN